LTDHPKLTTNNMNLPDKNNIGAEIRRIMADKRITGVALADALNVTTTTVVAIRDGRASYELLKRALDTLDNWEESK
jgi:DNA-binding Xre family transcriptional regulator